MVKIQTVPPTQMKQKTTQERERAKDLKGIFSERSTVEDLCIKASSDLSPLVMDKIYAFALLQHTNVTTKICISLLENPSATSQLLDNMLNNANLNQLVRRRANAILQARKR